MSFPTKGTIAYKVCALLNDEGSMTSADICAALAGHDAKAIRVAILRADEGHFIELNARGEYAVTRIMRRHLDQCEKAEKPKEVGQIVPPRNVNVFTSPMTGYTASLLRGKREPIREVSFINGSSFAQVGYRA